MTTPPLIGVPVEHPQGIIPAESRWVLGMAIDVQSHEHRLDQYHHFIDGLKAILDSHNEFMDRTLDAIIATRRAVSQLYITLTASVF